VVDVKNLVNNFSQEIPREELEADDADKVISVFHFSKELSRTHGVPFKFVVKRVRSPRLCAKCALLIVHYDRVRSSRRLRSVCKLG
jgi:hypothetical protein